jgi:hypothetical protein
MIAAHTPKTKQELFDFVLAAIRKQGRPSMNGAHCMYRAADGARCAAGHLIPDDLYDPEMEGKPIGIVMVARPGVIACEDVPFLGELQGAHDHAGRAYDGGPAFLRRYEYNMEKLARENGLTYTTPEANHA